MDETIKKILNDEYSKHPLLDLMLTYFERFEWNDKRGDWNDRNTDK